MEQLTNTIEAVLFASGKGVPIADIADKLEVTEGEVKKALEKLREKYSGDSGIVLLEFNKKAQFGSNPKYKDGVSAVLNPIREKELTRTILETAAIVAYKQPITRTEIELLRGVNSDYAVNALLDLKLIYPCGRKDAVGKPILFATTDEFLKRFKLHSLEDLPDYDTLMAAITRTEDRDSYLYAREELPEEAPDAGLSQSPVTAGKPEESAKEKDDGYEIPDFLQGLDEADIVKIG